MATLLKDYAIVGLVVLVFYRASARTALVSGVACLLAFPALIPVTRQLGFASPVPSPDLALYQSHDLLQVLWFGLRSGLNISLSLTKYADWNLVMLGCAFIGEYIQKIGLLENLAGNLPKLRRIFWCSLAFAVVTLPLRAGAAKMGLNPDDHYDVSFWPMLGQMAFFMSGICWLFAKGRLRRLLGALQIVGRMTLTNDFLQNLVGLLVFSGFGLGLLHRMPYSWHVGIALAVFVAQVYFSRWWLARYRLGPTGVGLANLETEQRAGSNASAIDRSSVRFRFLDHARVQRLGRTVVVCVACPELLHLRLGSLDRESSARTSVRSPCRGAS